MNNNKMQKAHSMHIKNKGNIKALCFQTRKSQNDKLQ